MANTNKANDNNKNSQTSASYWTGVQASTSTSLQPLSAAGTALEPAQTTHAIVPAADTLIKPAETVQAIIPAPASAPGCIRRDHNNPWCLCNCRERIVWAAKAIEKYLPSILSPLGHSSENEARVFKKGSGSFNIVFAAARRDGEPHDLLDHIVFRLPRNKRLTSSETTPLQEIQKRRIGWGLSSLRVPLVLNDFSDDSERIGWPFVVLERMAGNDLDSTWGAFNTFQKCSVAKDLGQIYHELITKTKNQCPGIICADENSPNCRLVPLGSGGWCSADGQEEAYRHPYSCSAFDQLLHASQQPLAPYFAMQHGLEWRKLQANCGARKLKYAFSTYDICTFILEEMRAIGLFGLVGQEYVLCHWDLFPRNILAKVDHGGSASVTGIIDWDGASYAPDFVACRPPKWMWRDCYLSKDSGFCSECYEDLDAEDEDFFDVAHDQEGGQVKRTFLDSLYRHGDKRRLGKMMFDPLFVMARVVFDILSDRTVARGVSPYPDKLNDDLRSHWTRLVNDDQVRTNWGFAADPACIISFFGGQQETFYRRMNWEI